MRTWIRYNRLNPFFIVCRINVRIVETVSYIFGYLHLHVAFLAIALQIAVVDTHSVGHEEERDLFTCLEGFILYFLEHRIQLCLEIEQRFSSEELDVDMEEVLVLEFLPYKRDDSLGNLRSEVASVYMFLEAVPAAEVAVKWWKESELESSQKESSRVL